MGVRNMSVTFLTAVRNVKTVIKRSPNSGYGNDFLSLSVIYGIVLKLIVFLVVFLYVVPCLQS